MSLKSDRIDPIGSNHPHQRVESFNAKSICALVAFAALGVAGVVIVALGAMHLFGSVRSIGFIASVAGGVTAVCLSLGGGIWIVVSKYERKSPVTQANPQRNDQGSVEFLKEEESEVEETPPPKPSEKVPDPIVFSYEESKERYEGERQHFRAAAQARFAREPLPPPAPLPNCDDPEFISNAEEAFTCFYYPDRSKPHIKTFRGNEHYCVATDKIPGFLFKQTGGSSTEEKMIEYVERTERARKICEKNDLYLLYIPKCKVVDFRRTAVVEEKAELLDGGWQAQKACYQWAIDDPQLQPYGKELLRQLALFICLTGLGDVKYDNIPLTKDGRIALFDLDESNAVTGLTSGKARRYKDGLFNLIPPEWYDEFNEIAKQHLSADDFGLLQERLPQLKERAIKRKQHKEQIEKFYQEQQITLPKQPLVVFDKKLFEKYREEIALFAEKLIPHLNQGVATLPHLSLVAGRKIGIPTQREDQFLVDMGLSENVAGYHHFKAIEKEGLDALQEQGYIVSYKIVTMYHRFSVVC